EGLPSRFRIFRLSVDARLSGVVVKRGWCDRPTGVAVDARVVDEEVTGDVFRQAASAISHRSEDATVEPPPDFRATARNRVTPIQFLARRRPEQGMTDPARPAPSR